MLTQVKGLPGYSKSLGSTAQVAPVHYRLASVTVQLGTTRRPGAYEARYVSAFPVVVLCRYRINFVTCQPTRSARSVPKAATTTSSPGRPL